MLINKKLMGEIMEQTETDAIEEEQLLMEGIREIVVTLQSTTSEENQSIAVAALSW